MKVGVVMPCINLWEKYTKAALESVKRAGTAAAEHEIEVEVFLIDNASTDETPMQAQLLQQGEAGFHYQRNNDQWGFQKSVNYGIKYFFDKGFDYVFVVNNDIVLHPQAIVRLVERMQKGGAGMVTCLDVHGEMDAERMEPNRVGELSDVLKESCPEAPHPCFSAFMVSQECWTTVGELDELFEPAYYEDNDYHYRMQLAGVEAILYPPAMFYHYGSRTQLEALGRPLTNSGNQHAQYIRKWGGDPGKERFKTPFNEGKPITWTRQSA